MDIPDARIEPVDATGKVLNQHGKPFGTLPLFVLYRASFALSSDHTHKTQVPCQASGIDRLLFNAVNA